TPWLRANASTCAIALGISLASTGRQGVNAWFERPRSRPGVARRTQPPSTCSVTVAGHASTACRSRRQTRSGCVASEEVTKRRGVADRVVAVAVVHQQVGLARLGGVFGDR